MFELEQGNDNKWPINWWQALSKLTFLMEARYNKMEPYYYIVRNKILEETSRCLKLENQMRQNSIEKDVDNLKLCPPSTTQFLQKTPSIDAYALTKAIRRHPNVYKKASVDDKANAWFAVALELNASG